MPIKVEEKKLYSVEDLAKILPITSFTVRAYFRKGRIKGHKIGKNWYVTKENLDAFLDGEETNNWRNIENEILRCFWNNLKITNDNNSYNSLKIELFIRMC